MEINEFELLIRQPENEIIDYKSAFYHSSRREDLLKDVISFANSHVKGSKYIVFGIKEKDGELVLIGVDTVIDQSNIDQLIFDNIEPTLKIKVHSILYSEKRFQILEIVPENRPYLLKKKFGSLEKGFMRIRRGATNDFITRSDLDKMYNDENVELKILDGMLYATKPDTGCANIRCKLSNYSNKPITIVFGYLGIYEDQECLTEHRLFGTTNNNLGADYQLKLLPKDEIIDYFEFGFSPSHCFPLGVDEYGTTDKKLSYKITFIDANNNEYIATYENCNLLVKGDFLWKVQGKNKRKIKQPR